MQQLITCQHGKGFQMVASEAREKLVLTVEEAGALLDLSRSSSYEAARRGDLPTIRIGRRLLVPRRALEKMLEGAGPQDDGTAE